MKEKKQGFIREGRLVNIKMKISLKIKDFPEF